MDYIAYIIKENDQTTSTTALYASCLVAIKQSLYLYFRPCHHSSQRCRAPRHPTATPYSQRGREFGRVGTFQEWGLGIACSPLGGRLRTNSDGVLLSSMVIMDQCVLIQEWHQQPETGLLMDIVVQPQNKQTNLKKTIEDGGKGGGRNMISFHNVAETCRCCYDHIRWGESCCCSPLWLEYLVCWPSAGVKVGHLFHWTKQLKSLQSKTNSHVCCVVAICAVVTLSVAFPWKLFILQRISLQIPYSTFERDPKKRPP